MNIDIQPTTVHNLPEFLKEIEDISVTKNNPSLWFRGIASTTHKLQPSIYRPPFTSSVEENLYHKFKARAIPFLNQKPNENYWEWLFLMQHHGVPTRLLDWSGGAIIALAFAIIFREEKYANDNAAVWCLNPKKLNENVKIELSESQKIPDITANSQVQYLFDSRNAATSKYPIAVTGPLNNDRIVAQKGAFTIFPNSDSFSLEDKDQAYNFLWQIIIPADDIDAIKKQMFYLGITESSIYPDLNNLALEIKREQIQ